MTRTVRPVRTKRGNARLSVFKNLLDFLHNGHKDILNSGFSLREIGLEWPLFYLAPFVFISCGLFRIRPIRLQSAFSSFPFGFVLYSRDQWFAIDVTRLWIIWFLLSLILFILLRSLTRFCSFFLRFIWYLISLCSLRLFPFQDVIIYNMSWLLTEYKQYVTCFQIFSHLICNFL